MTISPAERVRSYDKKEGLLVRDDQVWCGVCTKLLTFGQSEILWKRKCQKTAKRGTPSHPSFRTRWTWSAAGTSVATSSTRLTKIRRERSTSSPRFRQKSPRFRQKLSSIPPEVESYYRKQNNYRKRTRFLKAKFLRDQPFCLRNSQRKIIRILALFR